MNADRLLAHYENVADAPDAIARLRRFILDLAVRGKLVPQDANDEPASELLKRIAKAKARLDRKERIKKEPKNLIGEAEPVQMPRGWASAPLADLVTVLNGRAYKQNELLSAGTPVLRVGNLFTSDKWYYSTLQLDEDKYCQNGDLIFAWSASFGPFIWDGEKVIYHYHIWKLPPHSEADLDKLYLYNFLLQKTREIKESGHGISMIHMTKEKMEKLVIPLPPLAEQRRIVAKVDELMGLCDRLESAREARAAVRDRLGAASLARLNAPDPDTFENDARFALDALPALTTRLDQIKRLRQTILNLAVRGKLVPQDLNDEPASELLKRIAKAKARLLITKNTKAKQAIPRDSKTDVFALPSNWAWCQLDEVAWKITDGDHLTPKREPKGRYLLSARNVLNGRIDVADVDFVGKAEFDRMRRRCDPNKFDLLISCSGSVGRVAIVDQDDAYVMVRSAALVKPVFASELAEYLAKALISDCLQDQMGIRSKAAAQPNLFIGQIRQLMIPLPPLAEQYRIVAKVDALMALCDRLEASLTAAGAARRRLLDALLAEAIAPVDTHELEAAE